MVHESRFHEVSSFVTLTYDPDELPASGTLVKLHVSSFLKRLRKRIQPQKIRFYACGEYGDANLRPHYHLVIFGYWPKDAVRIGLASDSGKSNYDSRQLDETWGKGHTSVAQFTPEIAAYVARYVTKKITGDKAQKHYERVDPDTGEVHQVIPEFALMSRRPGIGRDHFESYLEEIYSEDFCVFRKHKIRVPKYYDAVLKSRDPERLDRIKIRRRTRAKKYAADQTPERLAVRETIAKAKQSMKKRNL